MSWLSLLPIYVCTPIYFVNCLCIFFCLLCCIDVYVAPEIYRDEAFDRSVDVHSFGVMLYEVHSDFILLGHLHTL